MSPAAAASGEESGNKEKQGRAQGQLSEGVNPGGKI